MTASGAADQATCTSTGSTIAHTRAYLGATSIAVTKATKSAAPLICNQGISALGRMLASMSSSPEKAIVARAQLDLRKITAIAPARMARTATMRCRAGSSAHTRTIEYAPSASPTIARMSTLQSRAEYRACSSGPGTRSARPAGASRVAMCPLCRLEARPLSVRCRGAS